MAVNFSILDETTSGECRSAGTFASESSATTLREIIRLRVQQEVERFNHSDARAFQGLIQPEETERLLNGAKPTHRLLDSEKQYASAITAFQGNGFLVLVDEHQVTELDEEVHIKPETKVTFLKLVPLIGG
jgi:hypothetical protein